MIELNFGVPSQRQKKEEKYPDKAVVTMLAYKGKGYAKKFEFNKKAEELLNLNGEEDYICMSFVGETTYVVKSTGGEPERYRMTKNSPKSFSNGKVYSYIAKLFSLNQEVENEFELTDTGESYGGTSVCEFKPLITAEEVVENIEATSEKEPQADIQAEVASIVAEEVEGSQVEGLPFN